MSYVKLTRVNKEGVDEPVFLRPEDIRGFGQQDGFAHCYIEVTNGSVNVAETLDELQALLDHKRGPQV